MPTILVIVAVGIAVAALVAGVAFMFRGEENSGVEDRLAALTTKGGTGGKGRSGEATMLVRPLDDGPSKVEQFVSRFLNLRRFIDQADVPITVNQFLLITGGAAVGGVLICVFTFIPMILAPLLAVVLGMLPMLWLFLKRRKRLMAFGKQLPEALELISRALRAGHSLAAGISLAANEMAAPLGKEFGRCYEEQNLGIPLEEALEGMTERVPNLDLRFFATAVILQRTTGGDLAEILDKIGHLIRERFKIWGQIQALTGEGRLSGVVLLALPPVLFVTMWWINPNYCMSLFTDPLGHRMLAGAVVMQLLGAIVIKKIITIKV